MSDDDKPILVYATFPALDVAEAIAGALVDAGLVACANIFPGIVSIYVWDGKRQRDQEVSALLKTTARLGDAVVAEVRTRHPYDTPAILVLPVTGGEDAFTAWIQNQIAGALRPAGS